MIIDDETRRKMRDMGRTGLIEAPEAQDDAAFMSASLEDGVKVAADDAYPVLVDGKVKRLVKRARLRHDYADIRSVDLDDERKPDRVALMQPATCAFVRTCPQRDTRGPHGPGQRPPRVRAGEGGVPQQDARCGR